MASPRILTQQDFTRSRFESLGEEATDLPGIIRRAEVIIGDKIGMELSVQPYTQTGIAKGSDIFLGVRPITAITSVSRRLGDWDQWTALSAPNYTIDANLGILTTNSDVLINGYGYQIVYAAGYTALTLPDPIKEAILIQTALLLFQDFEIYGAGDSKEPGIRHFRDDIEEYIAPYKRSRLVRI